MARHLVVLLVLSLGLLASACSDQAGPSSGTKDPRPAFRPVATDTSATGQKGGPGGSAGGFKK